MFKLWTYTTCTAAAPVWLLCCSALLLRSSFLDCLHALGYVLAAPTARLDLLLSGCTSVARYYAAACVAAL